MSPSLFSCQTNEGTTTLVPLQPKGSKRSKPGRQTARAVKLRIAEKLGDGQKEAACQGQAHSVETPHASRSRREDTDKPSTVVENDTGNAGASTVKISSQRLTHATQYLIGRENMTHFIPFDECRYLMSGAKRNSSYSSQKCKWS